MSARRRSALRGWLGVALFLAALALNSFLPDVASVEPTPDDALRFFERADEGPRYRLAYGFVDYAQRSHRVTCTLDKQAVEKARRGFGWDPVEVQREAIEEVRPILDAELRRRGLVGHARIEIGNAGWALRPASPWLGGDREQVQYDALLRWLRGSFDSIYLDAESHAAARRGFLVRDRTLQIDYNGLAKAATQDLDECYEALTAAAGEGASERYFMGLLLAFFQELRYELPPEALDSRSIFGMWVPSQVLADGKGDCDSKATAFASLWRHRRARSIVILVPGHALVGVEAKPGPGEKFVRVGNRYFVLCEVAGPGKIPPGGNAISGAFEYVEIEPLSPSSI